jgi:hypothetical protein
MATTSTRKDLSPDDLVRLLELMKGSDTVELKLTVPESSQRSTVTALGLDPLDAQIRQVFFFDTPDLTLDRHGVVVRARRVQGRGGDSVVKLRPVEPAELPRELRKLPSFGVEVDAMPGGFVCSGSLKASADNTRIRRCAAGEGSVRKLFTKDQRAFFEDRAPNSLALDDLSLLGPIFVLKLNSRPGGFGRKLTTEMWIYPDGSAILELSTKCLPSEAFQVAAEATAFLATLGVDLSGEQQTKTRTALEFFARELRREQAARR